MSIEATNAAALFFASGDSSFTTGADLPVDGGIRDLGKLFLPEA